MYHRFRTFLSFALLLIIGGGVLFALPALASDVNFGLTNVDSSIGLSNERSVIEIITGIIRIILGLLGIIVLGLILYAGFLWMTANGNEERISTAKRIMTNAVIGLTIILSAFAITQFIITQLSNATGSGGPGDTTTTISDCEAGEACTFCEQFPNNSACLNQTFFVKSITPSTDDEDNESATYMNTAQVRLVFSRPIAVGDINEELISVTDDSNDPVPMNDPVASEGNRVITITPRDEFLIGAYTIEVNEDITDYTGGDLQDEDVTGKQYPTETKFYVNRIYEDELDPELPLFTINGESNPGPQYIGELLEVEVAADDRMTIPADTDHVVGGVAMVKITVARGSNTIFSYRTGPDVRSGGSRGSSPAFNTEYIQTMSAGDFQEQQEHTVTVRVTDIAGNIYTETKSFPVYRPECNNGILDPGEEDIDTGGVCGSLVGEQCVVDADCSPYMQCVDGFCEANPVITDFDPKNAAVENWVTVFGRYFGSDGGTVEFGYPGADGEYVWTEAAMPGALECPAGDLWHPSWTIVEIPDSMPERDDIAIRITRAPSEDEPLPPSDSTLDTRGTTAEFSVDDTERPGLCTVLNQETATPQAAPRAAVNAFGRGFIDGTSEIFWGDRLGQITAFTSASLLESLVPEEFGNGIVGVRIDNGDGAVSNGIPFSVQTEESSSDPLISYIDPPATTEGSYITLFGNNFGPPVGQVFLSDTAGNASACASGDADDTDITCYRLNTDLPDQCGTTWAREQVIVQVTDINPSGGDGDDIPVGTYHLVLKTVSGRQTSGVDQLTVEDGAAKPSICKMSPTAGPAPLPVGESLRIVGENFGLGGTTGTVRFWDIGSDKTALDTGWLIADSGDVDSSNSTAELVSYTNTVIETIFPTKADGLTIPTGEPVPVKVRNAAGQVSNSITYEVNVCDPDTTDESLVCCTEGPAAGRTMPAGYACPGESRSAGYTWRISSGIIPKVPFVLEQCKPTAPPHPSPSPSDIWESGEGVCVNALVSVEFSLQMDDTTISPDSVRMFKCENGKRRGCEEDTNFAAAGDLSLSDTLLTIYNAGAADANLEPDTWYTVEIDRSVTSYGIEIIAGRTVTTTRPLQSTRPCGGNTAYCFDFKTSAFGAQCTIVDAYVMPSEKIIRELGPVEDYPGKNTYFTVLGQADQACVSLSARGLGWEWSLWNDLTADPQNLIAADLDANGEVEIDQVQPNWDDIRTLLALQEVTPQPMELRASTTTASAGTVDATESITGASNVTIALGDPQVSTYWPNCSAACSNATMGVLFNRNMLESTFVTDHITVYECRPEDGVPSVRTCGEDDRREIDVSIDTGSIHAKGFTIVPDEALERDTWYRVELSDEIRAIGGYNRLVDGTLLPLAGDAIEPFVWVYKTKANFDGCFVDSVDINPNGYLARFVNEKNIFGATPFGTPDECSPYGQQLNPYLYDWEWSIPADADPDVVTITGAQIATEGAPGCLDDCTPAGSDRTRSTDITDSYLCGNGSIDPGETCDIGMTGEVAGVAGQEAPYTCTYQCERPGNAGDSCGNSIVDNPQSAVEGAIDAGEQCDDGNTENGDGCSAQCLFEGSNPSSIAISDDPDASYCSISEGVLDGVLDPGESCELFGENTLLYRAYDGAPIIEVTGLDDPRAFCTDNCLMKGTQLAQTWCDHTTDAPDNQCRKAVSYCGNETVEAGEVCEIVSVPGPTDIVRISTDNVLNPTETAELIVTDIEALSICNTSCLLGNMCAFEEEVSGISTNLWCNPEEEEGCTSTCLPAGSSLAYTDVSICRDGNVDTGEYAVCERVDVGEDVFVSPYQLATAIGLSLSIDPITKAQESAIKVRLDRTIDVSGAIAVAPTGDAEIADTAPYFLQCGFTEYDIPDPVANSETGRTALEYNGCANADGDGGYELGVGSNSCCYPRAAADTFYPAELSTEVCRNTLMEVVYDGDLIDKTTVNGNIILARQIITGDGGDASSCEALGMDDVTDLVNITFADPLLAGDPPAPQGILSTFFTTVWESVVNWIKGIVSAVFGSDDAGAYGTASIDFDASNTRWCNANTEADVDVVYRLAADESTGESVLRVRVKELLATNRSYALLIASGADGVRDIDGVPIQPRHNATIFEGTAFTVGDEVCKIAEIDVQPEEHLFNQPFQDKDTLIYNETSSGEFIVPIPGVYNWEYSWAPQSSELFIIPVNTEDESVLDGDVITFSTSSDIVSLASTDVEAQQSALGRVVITEDIATESGDTTNKVFTDKIDLYARFCANPWGAHLISPTSAVWAPFENNRFNFSFWYCADARSPLSLEDDLPLFVEVVTTSPRESTDDPTDDIIERTFFFSDDDSTDDAVGVQIFLNELRLSPRAWFAQQFGTQPVQYENTTIDGYDAITNGTTYYVDALNVAYAENADGDVVVSNIFSNIYQFTINENASDDTRDVFAQIMENLVFNTNMTDWGYCLNPGSLGRRSLSSQDDINDDFACVSDFNCMDSAGIALEGTNGVCSNNRTALFRDIERLEDVSGIQMLLTDYSFSQPDGSYPTLEAGTFSPRYTVSRWGSWGSFIGGAPIPRDPLNLWTQCGGPTVNQQVCYDDSLTLFHCPAELSVYEYSVSEDGQAYSLHANLEFLEDTDPIVSEFLYTTTTFVNGSYCIPNTTSSPFAGACGNGIVNDGEDCDPAGSVVTQECSSGAGLKAQTCQLDCTFAQDWDDIACVDSTSCGNGVVEGEEDCDAGANNGLYGAGCSEECTFDGALFCGNDSLDFVDDNANDAWDPGETYYEFCDEVGGVCQFAFGGGEKIEPMLYFLIDKSGSMGVNFDHDEDTDTAAISRWDIITDDTGLPRVFEELQDITLTGLGVFSNDNTTLVDMAFTTAGQVTELKNDLLTQSPGGTTELGAAIQDLIITPDVFNTGDVVDAQRPKSLILVVDGDANDEPIPLITQLREEFGVYTYVIGVGITKESFNQWAEAGGSGSFFRVDDSDELLVTIRNLTRCYAYSLRSGNTCNATCSGYGTYCGDSIIQSVDGETCDDGNTVTGDGCDAYCQVETGFTPPEEVEENVGSCGDGLVQSPNADGVEEVCDLGASNGIAPDAVYGESQSYCSSDCRTILTVDAAGFCGDGEVQPEEVCDVEDGTVVASSGSLLCSDKGSFACTNACQTLVDNCVECVAYPAADPLTGPRTSTGAIPKLAVLNPLIAGNTSFRDLNESGYTTGPTQNTFWGQSQNDPGVNQRSLVDGSFFTFFRIGENNLGIPRKNYISYASMTVLRTGAISGSGDSRAFEQKNPWDFGFMFTPPSYDYTEIHTTLETSPFCADEYQVAFNVRRIHSAVDSDTTSQSNFNSLASSYGHDVGRYEQYLEQERLSSFSFPVDGESNVVEHTIVTSPAVPANALRVVIKWEGLGPAEQVVGNLYNQAFSADTRISYDLAKGGPGSSNDNFCDNMEKRDFSGREAPSAIANKAFPGFDPTDDSHLLPLNITHYWWPKISGANSCDGYGTTNDEGVFVHSIGSNEDDSVHIQSMTIDAEQIGGGASGDRVIPFFVTGIGATMQQLQNENITVEVYRYQEEQVPGYSFYEPDHVFTISEAELSSNPDAPFWHVFNIFIGAADEPWIINHNENDAGTAAIRQVQYMLGESYETDGKVLTRYCTLREISEKKAPGEICEAEL